MPVDPVTGQLISFTTPQIDAMKIRTFDVRFGGHPTESRRQDENVMTRTFLVDWASRFDFVELVCGRSKLWVDSGVTKLSRLLPDSNYGRHPAYQSIIATRIDHIKGASGPGIDDISGMPEYPDAEVQVFYEQFKGAIKSDASITSERERYCTREASKTEVEAWSLPAGAFKYVTAGGGAPHGTPLPVGATFMRPVRRFGVTWHWLPNDLYISNGALFERLFVGVGGDGIPWLGTINKEVIEFVGLGTYQPGQLLLEGVEERYYAHPVAQDGVDGISIDVTFNYAYTPRGWSSLFYFDPITPVNSGYYECTVDGVYYAANAIPDKKGLYNLRDHNSLFDPNPP